MSALPSLRLLLRGVVNVRLSGAARAALSTTCNACRAAHQMPWYEETPCAPTTQQLGGTQLIQAPDKNASQRGPYVRNPSEDVIFSWPIFASKHLCRRILIARESAMKAMQDPAAAPAAMDTFLKHLDHWSKVHLPKFNTIASALALLSVARLATRPEVPESSQQKATSTAAHILKHYMTQLPAASNHSVANVFWACARLQLRPDEVQQGFGDMLAETFIATAHEALPQGFSNVLWACSALHVNPLNGKLLETLVALLQTWLRDKQVGIPDMQSLSVVMCAFATMRLHVHASIAELIVRRFYEGLVMGEAQKQPVSFLSCTQGVSTLMWACASLGYCPPPHMLQQFMRSYASSQHPYSIQHDTTILYSLAVFGALTMEWFKATVQRLPQTPLNAPTLQQLYMGLQALRPQDVRSSAYKDWLQVTHSVQQQWPLRDDVATQSPFELNIYYSLVQMGYQAVPNYDSADGLHFIDIALLPQKRLPCKIAVEADGGTHYLYEDYRLDQAPEIATRPDGRTLFRNAVLRKQGWAVMTIPWFEWIGLNTAERRVRYLEKKIKRAVKEYRQASK